MDLVQAMGKPLKSVFIEFLRTQQCGFLKNYPTACCPPFPENLEILKHAKSKASKSYNKLSIAEADLRNIFNKVETTGKPLKSVRSKKIKEKMDAINKKFDMDDFFDFTGTFDLLRRRGRFINGLDVEIR